MSSIILLSTFSVMSYKILSSMFSVLFKNSAINFCLFFSFISFSSITVAAAFLYVYAIFFTASETEFNFSIVSLLLFNLFSPPIGKSFLSPIMSSIFRFTLLGTAKRAIPAINISFSNITFMANPVAT